MYENSSEWLKSSSYVLRRAVLRGNAAICILLAKAAMTFLSKKWPVGLAVNHCDFTLTYLLVRAFFSSYDDAVM